MHIYIINAIIYDDIDTSPANAMAENNNSVNDHVDVTLSVTTALRMMAMATEITLRRFEQNILCIIYYDLRTSLYRLRSVCQLYELYTTYYCIYFAEKIEREKFFLSTSL